MRVTPSRNITTGCTPSSSVTSGIKASKDVGCAAATSGNGPAPKAISGTTDGRDTGSRNLTDGASTATKGKSIGRDLTVGSGGAVASSPKRRRAFTKNESKRILLEGYQRKAHSAEGSEVRLPCLQSFQ